jgi:hypothetical protein
MPPVPGGMPPGPPPGPPGGQAPNTTTEPVRSGDGAKKYNKFRLKKGKGGDKGGDLLASIRAVDPANLRKADTVDKSKPMIEKQVIDEVEMQATALTTEDLDKLLNAKKITQNDITPHKETLIQQFQRLPKYDNGDKTWESRSGQIDNKPLYDIFKESQFVLIQYKINSDAKGMKNFKKKNAYQNLLANTLDLKLQNGFPIPAVNAAAVKYGELKAKFGGGQLDFVGGTLPSTNSELKQLVGVVRRYKRCILMHLPLDHAHMLCDFDNRHAFDERALLRHLNNPEVVHSWRTQDVRKWQDKGALFNNRCTNGYALYGTQHTARSNVLKALDLADADLGFLQGIQATIRQLDYNDASRLLDLARAQTM